MAQTIPKARFRCPACGADRPSNAEGCDACDWPREPRLLRPRPNGPARRRLQFHLFSVMVSMTSACVVFAAVGQMGLERLTDRLFAACMVALPLMPALQFYRWWRNQGLDEV